MTAAKMTAALPPSLTDANAYQCTSCERRFPWLYDTYRDRCRMCYQRQRALAVVRYPDHTDSEEAIAVFMRFGDGEAMDNHLRKCYGCPLCAELS